MPQNVTLTEKNLTTNDVFILKRVFPNQIYQDGKVAGVNGFKAATVTLPDFQELVVKVKDKPMPTLSNEEIREKNSKADYVYVKFIKFEGKLWQDFRTKENKVSASASDMTIVDSSELTFETI